MYKGPRATKLKRGGTDPAPLGAIVIRSDKVGAYGSSRRIRVRYIKIKMEGPTGLRWMGYARWWWTKNRGPIRAGMMVLKRNGDSLDDSPENLFLGGPGDKIQLAHKLDPEMSLRNRESCREGTRAFNRLSSKLARSRSPLSSYWYAVVDAAMAIIDLPQKSRPILLSMLGADTSSLPANGRGPSFTKAAESIGVRLARGRDLGVGLLGGYIRIDTETGVGIGDRARMDSVEIREFMKTDLWKRAEAAGKIPRNNQRVAQPLLV